MIQEIIVGLVVLTALVFAVRRILKTLKGDGRGCAGGCAGGCEGKRC